MKLTLTLLPLLLLITSCSSVISKDDCTKDMKSLGLEHGKKGLSSLADEVRSVCVNGKQSVDLELYEAGFKIGWNTYCTSFNGYE
ncbi:MAG: DUF2799 domain-containing protein, partial [Alphaproteobacteria bacterium]